MFKHIDVFKKAPNNGQCADLVLSCLDDALNVQKGNLNKRSMQSVLSCSSSGIFKNFL